MKRIIITESQYRHILNNRHILNEAETKTEVFKFKEAYPDNIAYPVKPGVTFNSVEDITKDKLTNEFRQFIEKLEVAVKSNPNIGQIKIAGGASNVNPTLVPPNGYDKKIVELSYRNPETKKVELNNEIIALNRGRTARAVIEALIPQLKGKVPNPSVEISEKMAKIEIPAGIIFMPQKYDEYKPPTKVAKSYPKQGDKNFQVTACNSSLKASGYAGNKNNGYIADVIKINTDNKPGQITFQGESYIIPDRFIIKQVKKGGDPKTAKSIKDSGFITGLQENEPDFTSMATDLNKYIPNSKLKGGSGNFNHTFKVEEGFDYFVEVYAPFGGTVWNAKIQCGEAQKPTTQQNQMSKYKGVPIKDGYNKYYINNKTKDIVGNNCGTDCNLYMDGEFKNGKLWNGKLYNYDELNILKNIRIYKNGKDVGEGTLEF